MAKHKEGRVEAYFVEQVEAAGGITRKAQWVGRRGCPDRFWALGGNGFAEIKSPDGKLDPHQQREIAKLRASGVNVVVLSSFEDVEDFVKRWGK